MRKRVQSDSPRSKATKLMKEAKLTREQSQKVRKHLILGSAVIVLIFQYSAFQKRRKKHQYHALHLLSLNPLENTLQL